MEALKKRKRSKGRRGEKIRLGRRGKDKTAEKMRGKGGWEEGERMRRQKMIRLEKKMEVGRKNRSKYFFITM